MNRSLLLLFVLAAAGGCKRGGGKPPAAGSGSGSAVETGSGSASAAGSGSGSGSAVAEAPSTGFAKPLSGPFATVDAYCATRPKGDDHLCETADVTAKGALPTGLLQAAIVYETNADSTEDVDCAVALRTSAGWFVGPASADICRQSSYIDLESVEVETDEAIAAITLGIKWHTKDGDDEAAYKLTALCGAGRGGVPACSPFFLSHCDAHAPTSGCSDDEFELTWTIEGDTATFKQGRTIDNETVPTGKQTILGAR